MKFAKSKLSAGEEEDRKSRRKRRGGKKTARARRTWSGTVPPTNIRASFPMKNKWIMANGFSMQGTYSVTGLRLLWWWWSLLVLYPLYCFSFTIPRTHGNKHHHRRVPYNVHPLTLLFETLVLLLLQVAARTRRTAFWSSQISE